MSVQTSDETRLALPPNKTYSVRSVSWTPMDRRLNQLAPGRTVGVMTISESRTLSGPAKSDRYLVREHPLPGCSPGRRFQVQKAKQEGKEHETYYVLVPPRGIGTGECQCTGFLHYGSCRHEQGILALVRNANGAPQGREDGNGQ